MHGTGRMPTRLYHRTQHACSVVLVRSGRVVEVFDVVADLIAVILQ